MGFLLAKPALGLLHTPEEYIGDSVVYLRTVSCGMAAVAAYNGVAAMLRALGDSKTPLIFLVFASLLNIGLDLLFVLHFNMAVRGVAIATVIAQGTSAAGCLIFAFRVNPYFKLKRGELKLDRDILGQCVRLLSSGGSQRIWSGCRYSLYHDDQVRAADRPALQFPGGRDFHIYGAEYGGRSIKTCETGP